MRLITPSLFAVLLAVTAFGQSADTDSSFDPTLGTVSVQKQFHRSVQGRGVTHTSRRLCSGVSLTPVWVLTTANCVNTAPALAPLHGVVHVQAFDGEYLGNPEVVLKVVTDPNWDLRGDPDFIPMNEEELSRGPSVPIERTADNLALIHMACPLASPPAVSIPDAQPSETSFDSEVIPWWREDEWRPRITGNTFKGAHGVWTFQSSQGPLPRSAEGTPLYFGQDVVGIYSGAVNDGATFVDITTKWEWITRTMRDEALQLPELCGR